MSFSLPLSPTVRMYAGFALYAFCLGNLFPRLPDIKAAMGVAEGALGLGLIGTPVGTLIALTLATPVVERMGFRLALMLAIPLMTAGFALASHAPNPIVFFILLLPVGLMIGSIEVMLNVEADRTEQMIGRRIMNRAHSFWSFGFFAAGLFGAGIAQLGISPQLHLAIVIPISLIGIALIFNDFEPAPHRIGSSADAAPLIARPTGPILVLVAVTLSAVLMEGASMDWSAIYMRSTFQSEPFVAGLAVAIFAFAHFIARFFADSFVERHSPSGVSRILYLITAAGILMVFASGHPAVSLAGFFLLGIGSSVMFPLAMSAAAQRTDRSAAINVAALAQISFIIFLVGPPLLGFVAEHWGIRWAYGLGLPLVLLGFVMAGALGGKPADPIEEKVAK